MSNKKNLGQFYTKNAEYIIGNLVNIFPEESTIVDPFAGDCDLFNTITINHKREIYDLDPQTQDTIKRDTLHNPLNYKGKWVLTNPPYLAKNKNSDKSLYEKYNLGDLYKIAMDSLMTCEGGVIIIPLNFFSDKDKKFRTKFLSTFKIIDINIFEEQVFDDTSYTVCAFSFIKEDNKSQEIEPLFYPSMKKEKYFLDKKTNYLIGDSFFKLIEDKNKLKINRLVLNGTPNSNLYLRAIDTGSAEGRISLSINKEHFYGKNTDRTFATLVLPNEYKNLSNDIEEKIVKIFNEEIEKYREKYKSLFLTNFRNSTSLYARKRIGFTMAYDLVSYIIKNRL